MNLTLKSFDQKQAEIIAPWFDDPETKKWLGDRKWIDNIFRLLKEPVGKNLGVATGYPFMHLWLMITTSL